MWCTRKSAVPKDKELYCRGHGITPAMVKRNNGWLYL